MKNDNTEGIKRKEEYSMIFFLSHKYLSTTKEQQIGLKKKKEQNNRNKLSLKFTKTTPNKNPAAVPIVAATWACRNPQRQEWSVSKALITSLF
jgi:hypothetical protein